MLHTRAAPTKATRILLEVYFLVSLTIFK